MTSVWSILIVVRVRMQISQPRSTHDPCRCLFSLDTKPARDHSQPFVFDCAGQGTTGRRQLRLRGQVGLEDRQTCFDRLVELFGGLVGAARVTGGYAEATDTLYVDSVSTPSATTHHNVYA